jgi:alpha-mannosidase
VETSLGLAMPLSMEQRLDRLKTRLNELPLWRVAESQAIEGWTFEGEPIALGAAWPHIDGAFRLEASATVPATWPLEETRLSLDVGGESLLTLSYPDGRAENFGIDPNHEEFPLLAREVCIATESVARKPFGQPVREPRLARAAFIQIEGALEQLHLLLTQIVETAQALGADEAVPHLMEAAETALRALDWPSHTPDYLPRAVTSRASLTVWRLPDVATPAPALSEAERGKTNAALEGLRVALRELKLRYPPRGKILLTGHAHIDLAWLWPYRETRRKLRRTFHTALGLMVRSESFRFNQSTAHYYWQLEQDDPALLARIKTKAESGQWEVLGAMWVEPDTNMPSGESLARQLLYGQRYFEAQFGARSNICWLPDCFGFSPALPQLLRQANVDSFFTIKVNWSEGNKFPHDLFWWEGLDGSKVLAHTFDNPLGGNNGRVAPDAYLPTWTNFRGKRDHDETLLAVGYGDGGGGVTPEMIERQRQLEDFPVLPSARWGTVKDFFARAHARAAERALPCWSGEIYLELHRATLTTQSGVKRRHREAERALVTAETVASLSHLLGAPAPKNLQPIWRVVLKNEFHDILPGSSIREVYQDAEAELDSAIRDAKAEQNQAMERLRLLAQPGPIKDALVIVNPSADARTIDLNLDDGGLSSEETIAPLTVRIIDRRRLQPAPGLKASARTLENTHLAVEIGDDGALARLVYKRTGREAMLGRGNQLWAYTQDKPRSWDAWDIDEDYEKSGEEIRAVTGLQLVEQGPHAAAIRVERTFRHSTINQTYRLTANAKRLDIETDIDWHERRILLRTLTPAAVRARYASFECAYGLIQRATHRNTSWEQAMFEAVAHRFVDLSEPGFGLALLNNAKYGHSVCDNIIGMSLVRGAIYPDLLADEGEQSFTYSLYPHGGDLGANGVRAEAEALNQPLLFRQLSGVAAAEFQPLGFQGAPAALSALKAAEDGDGLILRIYEPQGSRGPLSVSTPPGWRLEGPLNLLEQPFARDGAEDLMPFEVRSWRLRKEI